MPLEILLALVIGGIAGIAALLHLTGRSEPRILRDEAEALALWQEALPTLPPTRALLSRSRQAALIHHAAGLGILWALGQDIVARPLPRAPLRLRETARHLILHLPDFTAPHIRIALDADERSTWRRAIEETPT